MIELKNISLYGQNLARPECVVCTSNGRVYASNIRGGITVIEPDGKQWDLLATAAGFELHPNGFCLLENGDILLAHLGAEKGGVYRLRESGELEPFLTHVHNQELPPTNFVYLDRQSRIWVTVSTSLFPRSRGYRADVADGFIILIDNNRARIVADNLGYTNECAVHPDGKRLFVNETFAKRLSSYDIAQDGSLSNRTTIAQFPHGTFPDGLTFDIEGGIWVTSIVSNRVIRLSSDGNKQTVMIEDNDPEQVDWFEKCFEAGELGRSHLDQIKSRKLKNISSLAFGGRQMRDIYIGCLLGQSIYTCKSSVRGHPPTHWDFVGPRNLNSN